MTGGESLETLRKYAKKYGIDINDKQLSQFDKYYEMLIETNKVMNLTAITEKNEVIIKHFLDSIILVKYYDLSNKRVLDVGSGAGFPGIPLKIIEPSIKLTMMDSLNKRVKFLDNMCIELGLHSAAAVHMRAEDMARNKQYREQFDVVTSRAVANFATLSEYCLPFVKLKGCFIAYKSVNMEEELESADNAIKILGGKVKDKYTFEIDDNSRAIVVVDKIKATAKAYPRKAGTPAKNPL
ncbi:MAG: 16S rRNA (guanine(527)-N(7))-methyltransferase RsmG [Lachnospiraceae bacterium]|nr:16S rRNA (guanine(527)-N(7))-methyltransferase RsmG [Lachnospiraceae bacterium]